MPEQPDVEVWKNLQQIRGDGDSAQLLEVIRRVRDHSEGQPADTVAELFAAELTAAGFISEGAELGPIVEWISRGELTDQEIKAARKPFRALTPDEFASAMREFGGRQPRAPDV